MLNLHQKFRNKNLQPIRELGLSDPNTEELSRSYQDILAQAKEQCNDNIIDNADLAPKIEKYNLQPMQELALIDPKTGELPRNYKEILAQQEREAHNVNNKPTQDSKEVCTESKFKLQPMPELFLVDPKTGKLPKNYKEILAERKAADNNKSEKDVKEVCSEAKFTLQPMPELFLIDPITGELPKNYKEILAERKAADNNKSEKDVKEVCSESKFKLQPMPELFLIDPITGVLPKNYKDILKERKAKGLPIHTYWEDQNKDTKAKMEIAPKKIASDLFRQSSIRNKSVRKVLFQNAGKGKAALTKTKSSQVIKVSEDTIPLLDLEECAEKLRIIKKKPKVAKKMTPAQKRTGSARKRSSKSSNSSMEEFLKNEQQCKTPKSIMKRKHQRNSNHLKHGDDIVKAVDDIKALCKEIEESNRKIKEEQKKIEDNMNKIMPRLRLVEEILSKNIEFSSIDNKENSQLQLNKSSPNPIGTDVTLRIPTLKRNLQRKVLFEVNENDKTASPTKHTITAFQATGTPNTMVGVFKKIADNQYLQLQDTPKAN